MKRKLWAVIPAAGFGRRMGSDIPKQYLPLSGRTVIEWTLSRFLDNSSIAGVVVAISDDDPYWQDLGLNHPKLVTAKGGSERSDSVLSALHKLDSMASPDDWVLVHDAARPCLTEADLEQLIGELRDHPVGGVLGTPMSDTVKKPMQIMR